MSITLKSLQISRLLVFFIWLIFGTLRAQEIYYNTPILGDNSLEIPNHNLSSSCLVNGSNYSILYWFKAISNNITIRLDPNGEENPIRNTYLTLFSSDSSEIACRKYKVDSFVLEISYNDLFIDSIYYIQVDNANKKAYTGTFKLEISDSLTNDFWSDPIKLEHNYSDSSTTFSSFNKSGDGERATCWTSGPNFNSWFSFSAISNDLFLEVLTLNNHKGIEKTQVGLYDNYGDEIGCERFYGSKNSVELSYRGLTIGQDYYLAIDNSSKLAYTGDYFIVLSSVIPPGIDGGGALPLSEEIKWYFDNGKIVLENDTDRSIMVEYSIDGETIELMDYSLYKDYKEEGYYRLIYYDFGKKYYTHWKSLFLDVANKCYKVYSFNGAFLGAYSNRNDIRIPINTPCFLINENGKAEQIIF